MSKKKPKIKSLQLVIGDKEIDLTLREAKELFSELKDIFGQKETVIRHEYDWWYRPYRRWDWLGSTGTYTVSDNVTLKMTMDEPIQLSTTSEQLLLEQ